MDLHGFHMIPHFSVHILGLGWIHKLFSDAFDSRLGDRDYHMPRPLAICMGSKTVLVYHLSDTCGYLIAFTYILDISLFSCTVHVHRINTLQKTKISHRGKKKIIFKSAFKRLRVDVSSQEGINIYIYTPPFSCTFKISKIGISYQHIQFHFFHFTNIHTYVCRYKYCIHYSPVHLHLVNSSNHSHLHLICLLWAPRNTERVFVFACVLSCLWGGREKRLFLRPPSFPWHFFSFYTTSFFKYPRLPMQLLALSSTWLIGDNRYVERGPPAVLFWQYYSIRHCSISI